MLSELNHLRNFRDQLYSLFPKRKDAIFNLLDSLSLSGAACKSVVELSESPAFDRKYSSITDAIADGLTHAEWEKIESFVFQTAQQGESSINRFVLDCTSNPRPFARKLKDRSITHYPNPAPGNKPICVGHQYSLMGLLPEQRQDQEKHWIVPLSVKRVESQQKGNEVGMSQIIEAIKQFKLTDQLSMSIGDSLYGTEACRAKSAEQDNLIHLFRLNSKRNFFAVPDANNFINGHGRKKEYGRKMALSDPKTHINFDQENTFSWINKKGAPYTATIRCWQNMLLRGSRKFRSSTHPINVIQIVIKNDQGKSVFRRPLWLAIFGQRRHELDPQDAYKNYAARYDIEHFFRFGKRRLLMNKYQTPDVNHEESWWRFTLLSYFQLYLSRNLAKALPRPWERYLKEYQWSSSSDQCLSPSQVQRDFGRILKEASTPASKCIARGINSGRLYGEKIKEKLNYPTVFKQKAKPKSSEKAILSGFAKQEKFPNPQKIDDILVWVKTQLKMFNITQNSFAARLLANE